MSLNNNNSATKKPTPSGTTDSPYLGSKISLVSKAKIRYEGILYTIDANESTVALSKVRSFGTEDRPTDRPVPPRDEIFEYIIFRGADIEDLQVREPPQTTLTQDPAIVESSMYPSTGRSTASGNLPNSSTTNSNNVSSPSVPSGSNRQMKSLTNNDPLRQLNTQSTSRSFNQQQNSDGQDFSYGNQRRSGRQQQDYYNDQRRTGSGKYGYNEWPRTNNSAWENNYRQNQPQQQRYPRQQQQQQQQNYENNNRFYPNRRQQQQQQQSNGGYRERRNSTGEMTGNQQRNNRQRVDSTRGNANNQSALKFIGDFDFEKSNAEFDKNAIEDEIKKSLSIKTTKDKTKESTPTEQPAQIENLPTEQSPAPTQPTSITTVEKTERQDQDANPDGFYDKQKSFFDRISCETTEKEKTSNARRNWNEERRLNAETFGLRYRPGQQQQQQQQGGGYQRNTGGYNYNNNNQRRNYGGGQQQSFYGNGARYQRGGGGGGGGSGQQRGRNNTYYNNNNNNNNNRMRAY